MESKSNTLPGPLAEPDLPRFLDGRDDGGDMESLATSSINPKVMSFIRDDWIRKQMTAREAEFTEYTPTRVFVGTYNVNGKKPQESITPWLLGGGAGKPMADIYAVGFQEIVDLNAQNVLADGQTASRSTQWADSILATLNEAAAERGGDGCVNTSGGWVGGWCKGVGWRRRKKGDGLSLPPSK